LNGSAAFPFGMLLAIVRALRVKGRVWKGRWTVFANCNLYAHPLVYPGPFSLASKVDIATIDPTTFDYIHHTLALLWPAVGWASAFGVKVGRGPTMEPRP
jgi:hypothetical protein